MSLDARTPATAALLLLVLVGTLGPRERVVAQSAAATITVDANANRRAISPLIYGVSNATEEQLKDLNCPLNRSGGNETSRYNWELNAANKANDFYFESLPDSSSVQGERGDTFINQTRSGGAQAMLTIPLIGWVANLGPNRAKLASFSQAKYGPQTGNDGQFFPDAGNGILRSTNKPITGNDPKDANVAVDSTFHQEWVSHLVTTWGTAANGGLRYYVLDNEHSIWHQTHRDVHPTGAKMEEIRDRMLDYAAKIKAVDPSALTVGPEEWGWSGYIYSGFDQQWGKTHGYSNLPDRQAHGGQDYLPWLLGQLRQRDAAGGPRLLDVFSVHFYPQGGEWSDDVSPGIQLKRNRSTRSLWDPNYVDESWIAPNKVQLIPRLRKWVNSYYPGTKIALTEYNWGADNHINGATTQADILGILGREGLDLGARWKYPTPDPNSFTYLAQKIYRNYDGNKSVFGETSVGVTSSANPDNLSAFAATRAADGALTLVVVNKALTASRAVTVKLVNVLSASAARPWQLTSSRSITRLADVNVSGGQFTTTLPAQSVTLFEVPGGTRFSDVADATPNPIHLGETTKITFRVTCTGGAALPDGVVGLEIYDSEIKKVAQQNWTSQSFQPNQTRTYTFDWNGGTKPGTYTMKVGVFGKDSTPRFYWEEKATTIKVLAAATTFSGTAAVRPNPVRAGQATNIEITVTCTGGPPLSNALVDLEVYDSQDKKVDDGQTIWRNQSFDSTSAPNRARTYKAAWKAPATSGTYTVKIGVFGSVWLPVYFFNNDAAKITVQP